jgi:hypothetical protein
MNRLLIATLLATVAIAPAYAKDKNRPISIDDVRDAERAGKKFLQEQRALEQYGEKVDRLEGRLDGAGDDERQRIENIIKSVTEKYEARWGELPDVPPPPPPEPTSIDSSNFGDCIGLTTCTIGRATITANNGKLDVANSDGFDGLGVQGEQGDALIEGQSLEFVRVDFESPTMISEITVNHLFGYSSTLEFKSDGNRNGPAEANGTASTLYTNYEEAGGAPAISTGFSLGATVTLLDDHAGLWRIEDPWDAPVNYIELHPATTSATGGVSLSSISFETADSFVGY